MGRTNAPARTLTVVTHSSSSPHKLPTLTSGLVSAQARLKSRPPNLFANPSLPSQPPPLQSRKPKKPTSSGNQSVERENTAHPKKPCSAQVSSHASTTSPTPLDTPS